MPGRRARAYPSCDCFAPLGLLVSLCSPEDNPLRPLGFTLMLDRFFGLSAHQTTVRTEMLAGLVTFLTMAYIIFVQPAVLSGNLFGQPTGMDFGAITTAT